MKRIVPILLLALCATAQVASAEGNLLLLNETGANLSSLNVTVVPGSSNSSTFRISAQNDNITNAAIFYLGSLNVTVSPANVSSLPVGDSLQVTVTVLLSNDSAAGVKKDKLIILTSKPERLELPLFVTVHETNAWGLSSPANISRNISLGEAGLLLPVMLNNSGNVEVVGRVTVVDLSDLIWMDESNFTLKPGEQLNRPLYFSVQNGTKPGLHTANISFFDSLNNARRMNVSLALADVEKPQIEISLSADNITPRQRIEIMVEAQDNVNVSKVWGRIDSGEPFSIGKNEDVWTATLVNQTVGAHSLAVFANDTSNNTGIAQESFIVTPYDYITSKSSLSFYRFKPGQARSAVLLSSSEKLALNITLKSMTWTNKENNSLNVSVLGDVFSEGVSKNIGSSGDLMISVVGKNNTEFSGVFSVQAPSEVKNPNPEIAFSGVIGDYYVALPISMVVAGTQIDCSPEDLGIYDNSSYVCSSKYPVDVNSSEISIAMRKPNYDAMVEGYEAKVDTRTEERDGARVWNWLLVFIILATATGFLVKTYWWDRTQVKMK